MNYTKNLTAILLFSSGVMSVAAPVFADIETTTVKTTSITTNGTAFNLPTTSTYFLIDPITGNVKGNFDPMHNLTDTRLLESGLVIINHDTGKVIATVDSSGRPIELSTAPAFNSLVVAIDSRRAELERMIADALSRGTMDAAEAAALRTELNRIESAELSARQSGGVLTYSEALSLALDLNGLGDRLIPFMPVQVVTPLLGARMIDSNGQLVVVNDIDYRYARLSQRINDEYTAGRLSAQQVARLKEQLDAAASLEAKYRKNGELSPSKTEKISVKLDSVKTKLDQDVADINEKRSRIGLKVN